MSLLRRRLMQQNFGNLRVPFQDAEVERICVENWGADGKITYSQIMAVTDLELKFKGNTRIRSFNELALFRNLTSLNAGEFQDCAALEEMDVSQQKNLSVVGNYWEHGVFQGCTSLSRLHGVKEDCKLYDYQFTFKNCFALSEDYLCLSRSSYGRSVMENVGIKIANFYKLQSVASSTFGKVLRGEYIYLPVAREIHDYNFFFSNNLKGVFIGNSLEYINFSWTFLGSSNKYIVLTSKKLGQVKSGYPTPVYVPDSVIEGYKSKFTTITDIRKLSDFKNDFPDEPEIPWEYEL